jgi:xanthine dehydrogenase molybdenum-binding subunit
MGIAGALYEKVIYDGKTGRTINANYSDYKIPTIHEHPFGIEVVVLEEPVADGPYGAKGIGEVPIVAIAPAIANAIQDATGNRIRNIPITPEDIWRSIRSNGQLRDDKK